MNFLRNFLASFLALVIFCVIGVIIFFTVISFVTSEKSVKVTSNTVLHLTFDKPISEIEFDNPLDEVGLLSIAPSTMGLVQLKEAILKAKDDENIKGIYLEVPNLMAGLAVTEEIRQALLDFKETGKFIIAYGEYYSEGGYYLASVASKVYMHPEGSLELNGLSANVSFFKGLFDKLAIEPQIFRVGEFKSAVEPFMRKDMSEANRQQITSMLTSLNTTILKNISDARDIDSEEIKLISNKMLVREPAEAVTYRLIDSLAYQDEVINRMKELTGIEKDKELNLIEYDNYKKSYSKYKSSDNEVAVIVASGEIISGEGDMNTIGADKFIEEIKKARENEDIKSIVLRINSPGGSFVASDAMWREIKITSDVKPVIASMSDVAASGGYYMGMACDTIVAQPNTITGSIGIFGMVFNFKGFLNDKLGITNEEVNTGEYSGMNTVTRPLTDQEREIIQNDIEAGYETFVTKAAEGRHMSVEEIKKVASGRVWTGSQAMENGLVDVLGDFDAAITIAANAAGVQDDFKVRYYPKQRSIFQEFFKEMEEDSKAKAIQQELGELYPYFEAVKRVKNMSGMQARMPYVLNFN